MQNLQKASARLLEPVGIAHGDLERVVGGTLGPGIDYADIYFESSRSESWSLEDGIVKSGTHAIDQGVGVRAVSGEKTGFAYSDEIKLPALTEAASTARAIARSGGEHSLAIQGRSDVPALYSDLDPIDSLSADEKVALLRRLDERVRAADPCVKEVMLGLSAKWTTVLVASTDGELAADIRPLIRLNVSVVAERDGRRESASYGGGARSAYEWLLEEHRAESIADEAVRQVMVNLDAIAAPAGSMTVVLGNGWPGILLHEAIGHGLEGDFNRKGSSAFSGDRRARGE